MARPWHERDPAFFEAVQRETLTAFPDLQSEVRGDKVWVFGPLALADEDGVEIRKGIEVAGANPWS